MTISLECSKAMASHLNPREAERLTAVAAYAGLDALADGAFDQVVAAAADLCNASMAFLALIGEKEIWFKAGYHWDQLTAPRSGWFCSPAIFSNEITVVHATSQEPAKQEQAKQEPAKQEPVLQNQGFMLPVPQADGQALRSMAAVPLFTEDGLAIGVFCVGHHQPLQLNPLQQQMLKTLGQQVMQQLELHKKLANSHLSLQALHHNVDDLGKNLDELRNKNLTVTTLNQNKDKFIAIIAHDLKAAFHGLLGFSEILDTEFDELTPEAVRKIASYLNETSHSTYHLLENLLEWAMLENGAMSYRPQALDLERVVDSVVTGLHTNAEQKDIHIEQKIAKNLMVQADINMLKSLLQNLLCNAIKFSHQGSVIKLYSQPDAGRIKMLVEDQGTGMHQAQIDKLFKVELAQSTKGTSGEKGTGLGLLLCQQFAQKHGSQLQVESRPGEGSTFYFWLDQVRAVEAHVNDA